MFISKVALIFPNLISSFKLAVRKIVKLYSRRTSHRSWPGRNCVIYGQYLFYVLKYILSPGMLLKLSIGIHIVSFHSMVIS